MDEQLFQQLLAQSAQQPAPSSPTEQAPTTPTASPTSTEVAPAPTAAPPAAPPVPTAGDILKQRMASGEVPHGDTLDALVGGVSKAVFETKDFLFGDTKPQDQGAVRSRIEARTEDATQGSIVNSAVEGISQFATGMLGAGKFVKAAQLVPKVGAAVTAGVEAIGKTATSIGRAAAVGAIAFDPHQERLSNLAEQVPVIGQPMFGWLAAHPGDSEATGRMKAALESIGLDVGLLTAFMAAGKVYRAIRSGTPAEVEAATSELEAAQKASVSPAGEQNAPGGAGVAEVLPPSQGAAGEVVETPLHEMTPQQLIERARVSEDTNILGERKAQPGSTDAEFVDIGAPTASELVEVDTKVRTLQRQIAETEGVLTSDAGPRVGTEGHTALQERLVGQRQELAEAEQRFQELTAGEAPPAQGQKPLTAPPVKASPEDAERIIAQTREDLQALSDNGDVAAALANGHVFASGGESIPWQKIGQSAEDVNAFTATVAETLEGQLSKVKGGEVLSDASVDRRVRGIASYFNINPETIVGRILTAGDDATRIVANMEAAYLLSNRMHLDAFNLANRIALGDLAGFATREAAVQEFQRQVQMAASMFASGQSIRASVGRGMRRLRTEFQIPAGLVDSIESLGGEKLMNLFKSTMGDPEKLKLASQPSFLKKAAEELGHYVQGNLLWSPTTHLVNFISNAYMAVARPAERILGGTLRQVAGYEDGGEIRREAVKQYSYMMSSWMDGLSSVWQAIKTSDGVLDPKRTGAAGEGMRGLADPEWMAFDSFSNVLHNAYVHALRPAIGGGIRVLTAADEMAKQVVYRSKVAARANMEGTEAGLAGRDLEAFVKQKLTDAFDESGQAIDKAALQEARVATFSQDLLPGTIGTWVRQGVASHPLLRLVLPFTQTPTNIFRYTAKLMPGANLMQQEYRQQLFGHHGPEAQAQAAGQMALGTLLTGGVAMSGLNLTGGGPQDPKVKEQLMATGWRPYSLVVTGGDGTKHYLPIGRVDPISLPFGIVADIQDYLHTGGDASKAQDAISALTFSLIRQAANKTYLQGITKAADAFTNPGEGNALLKFGQGMATELTPFSSLLKTVDGYVDPWMREARHLTDAIIAITPGLSDTLPAKYDGLGQPVGTRNTFISSSPPDKVTAELQRLDGLGYTIPPATPSPGNYHADLRDISTKDGRNAYEVYQQLSARPTPKATPLKDVIGKVMASEAYQKAPDNYSNVQGSKAWMLEGPVAAYRKAALAQLMTDKTVRDALLANQQKVINAYKTANDPKAAAKGPWDTLKDIGEKFGMRLSETPPDIALPPTH